MDILVVGLTLRTAGAARLEAIHGQAALERVEARMRALPGVREVVPLATCHRVELVLGVALPLAKRPAVPTASRAARSQGVASASAAPGLEPDGPLASLQADVVRAFAEAVDAPDVSAWVSAWSGPGAYRHLLEVGAGLDSPVVGEGEILGQLRAAYAAASERGATGPILNRLFHRLFRAVRKVRARSGLDHAWTSPAAWSECLAAAILSAANPLTAGHSLHLLGSGALARGLSTHLRARGVEVVEVRAETLADEIATISTLITASGRGRALRAAELRPRGAPITSDGHALEIWDLGMPRNVDPAVGQLARVRLRTLADLPMTLHAHPDSPRSSAAEAARELIEAETSEYAAWRRRSDLAPSIVRLGRLLENAAFDRELLAAFVSAANDAADEQEAHERLELFERVLNEASRAVRARRSSAKRSSTSATRKGLPAQGVRVHAEIAPAQPTDRKGVGRVSLVGAGPGDPGLLTLTGAARLAEADVVYYDALASPELLRHCRPDARLIHSGKRRGAHGMSQTEIEAALVREARAGWTVVRLKGGDPFVFGRGGEEALTLLRSGVSCEVVPGVSSGTAVPALAGIPLTHRGISGSAAFVTAHDLTRSPRAADLRRRLRYLARGADTLVIFMAGTELAAVKATLLEAGLAWHTPAALIESGSTELQRTATATLQDLDGLGAHAGDGPILVVVGRTVTLRASLSAAAGAPGNGTPAQAHPVLGTVSEPPGTDQRRRPSEPDHALTSRRVG